MKTFSDEAAVMQHAISIARQAEGCVEPNPMVGAVIVDDNLQLVAEGWHQTFGEAHAEVNAIRNADGRTQGLQLYVTLEPCSHHGKTPPCADAVIAAGFRKVVIGCTDPAPHVAGRGIARLKEAGIEVIEGLLNDQATRLIAPFAKLMSRQQPWVHAKWAMTLDGRIAAASGHSKWISNEVSRGHVHQLRGRMDAIVTGAGTVRSDDPLLTARPTGPRTALRVVLDSTGQSITADCQLVKSVREAPVLVCVAEGVDGNAIQRLQDLGCEVLTTPADPHGRPSLQAVLTELGKRQCTNVLLEAGSGILGSAFDSQLVDEVHVFVAPKIVGGQNAMSPVGGIGLKEIPSSATLSAVDYTPCGSDLYIRGDVIH